MSPLHAPVAIAGSLSASHGTPREQLAQAARQFEAIFVRQMLAAARKTDFGGDVLGGEGLQTFKAMQDEKFADIAADTGAFGLARMIEKQLSAALPSRLREGPRVGVSGVARPRTLPQAGGEE